MTEDEVGRRSEWLDVLRALAITLVVFRHGVAVPGLSAPESSAALPIYVVAQNGWLGVDLFFVLSGFLLSSQILRTLEAGKGFDRRRFLVRRALRTLPAYIFVVFLLWGGFLSWSLGTSGVGDIRVLLVHLMFLNDYLGSGLMITLWSLATEEKFYLVMALAVPLLWRKGASVFLGVGVFFFMAVIVVRTATALAVPADSYVAFFWSYRAPFHFAIDGLILGVLAGAIRTRAGDRHVVGRWGAGLGLLLLLLILAGNQWAKDTGPMGALFAVPAFALVSAVLVLAAPAADRVLHGCIGGQVWRFLSVISYPLYLVHYPVAQLTSQWLDPVGSHPLRLAAYWVCYLAASLVTGWLLHALVERPGLRWRERLTSRAVPQES